MLFETNFVFLNVILILCYLDFELESKQNFCEERGWRELLTPFNLQAFSRRN